MIRFAAIAILLMLAATAVALEWNNPSLVTDHLDNTDKIIGLRGAGATPVTIPGSIIKSAASITNATINGSGHLILTLSNSTQIDAGLVQGGSGVTTSRFQTYSANKAALDKSQSDAIANLQGSYQAASGTIATVSGGVYDLYGTANPILPAPVAGGIISFAIGSKGSAFSGGNLTANGGVTFYVNNIALTSWSIPTESGKRIACMSDGTSWQCTVSGTFPHAATHATGGGDAITIDQTQIRGSVPTFDTLTGAYRRAAAAVPTKTPVGSDHIGIWSAAWGWFTSAITDLVSAIQSLLTISEAQVTNLTDDLAAKKDKSSFSSYSGNRQVEGTADLIIAASNITRPVKADYYCSGTSDDAKIRAAVNKLRTTGGSIRLTAGTFNLYSSVGLPSNITIVGSGPGATILNPMHYGTQFHGTPGIDGLVSHTHIRNLSITPAIFGNVSTVVGNGSTVTVTTTSAHGLTSGTNVFVVGYGGGSGNFNGVYPVTATDSTHFTYAGTGTGRAVIKGEAARITRAAMGITMPGYNQSSLDHVRFANLVQCFHAYNAWDMHLLHSEFMHGGSENGLSTAAIVIEGPTTAGVEISGSRFECGEIGCGSQIFLTGTAEQCEISGNKFENYFGGSMNPVIKIVGGRGVGISDNTFSGAGRTIVDIDAASYGININNNRFDRWEIDDPDETTQSVIVNRGSVVSFQHNSLKDITDPNIPIIHNYSGARNVRVANNTAEVTLPWVQEDHGSSAFIYHNTGDERSAVTAGGTVTGAIQKRAADGTIVANNKFIITDAALGTLASFSNDWTYAQSPNLFMSLTSFNDGTRLVLRQAGGAEVSPTATPNGQVIAALSFRGYDSNGFSSSSDASVASYACESFSPGHHCTEIRFAGTPKGSGTVTEWARMIDGKLGVGTSSPVGVLDVAGDSRAESFSGRARAGTVTSPTGITTGSAAGGTGWPSADNVNCEVTAFDADGYETTSDTFHTQYLNAGGYPSLTWTAVPNVRSTNPYRVYCYYGNSNANSYYKYASTTSLSTWVNKIGNADGQATPPSTYLTAGPIYSKTGYKFPDGNNYRGLNVKIDDANNFLGFGGLTADPSAGGNAVAMQSSSTTGATIKVGNDNLLTVRPQMTFMRSGGTLQAPTNVKSGMALGMFLTGGYLASGWESAPHRFFQATASQDWTDSNGGYSVSRFARADNTVAGPIETDRANGNGSMTYPTSYTPATSTTACTAGTWSWDATYQYFCPTTNYWYRQAWGSSTGFVHW